MEAPKTMVPTPTAAEATAAEATAAEPEPSYTPEEQEATSPAGEEEQEGANPAGEEEEPEGEIGMAAPEEPEDREEVLVQPHMPRHVAPPNPRHPRPRSMVSGLGQMDPKPKVMTRMAPVVSKAQAVRRKPVPLAPKPLPGWRPRIPRPVLRMDMVKLPKPPPPPPPKPGPRPPSYPPPLPAPNEAPTVADDSEVEVIEEEPPERDPDLEWGDELWTEQGEEDEEGEDETWGGWKGDKNTTAATRTTWGWGWNARANNQEETKHSRSWNKKLGTVKTKMHIII